MYYFYIFRCKDQSLYSGSTGNMQNREILHNSGRGSKYVFSRGGGKIVYFEKFRTKSKAMKREVEIKKWPRMKKLKLIESN